MTREEIISNLLYMKRSVKEDTIEDRTIDEVIKAVEKTEPRPVFYITTGFADFAPVYDEAICPDCGYSYEEGDKDWGEPFCPHCGQALNWEIPEEGATE